MKAVGECVSRPVFGDFPRTPEVGARRRRQDEIAGSDGLKQLQQLAGGVRHGGNFREADDLMQRRDANAISLASHLETDNVQLTVHEDFRSLRM